MAKFVTVMLFLCFGFLLNWTPCIEGFENKFGDEYEWHYDLEESIRLASEQKKPILLVVQEPWCPKCEDLGYLFSSSAAIEKYEKKFILTTGGIDIAKRYPTTGNYVPRILFVTPDGKLLKDIFNENGNKNYKYYYTIIEHIVKSIKRCLKTLKKGSQNASSTTVLP